MKLLTEPFNLLEWRLRMRWTQAQAAAQLCRSEGAYREMEHRNEDRPGYPCDRLVARLCRILETHEVVE